MPALPCCESPWTPLPLSPSVALLGGRPRGHPLGRGGSPEGHLGRGVFFAAPLLGLASLAVQPRPRCGRLRRGRRGHRHPLAAAQQSTGINDGAGPDRGIRAEPVAKSPRLSRKTGVVLLNIGTPASTSVADVREYLDRLLGDDRVIEIQPAWLKWIVLQGLLSTRPQKAVANYKKIWDPARGSPLLFHTQDLAAGLQRELGEEFVVKIGFQYSEPFTKRALEELKSRVDKVVLVPMFPHYASGTTGSCLANAYRTAAELYCTPYLSALPPFYSSAYYRSAMQQNIAKLIGQRGSLVDHLLFSFHGLPVEQCSRTDETGTVCARGPDCCTRMIDENRNCYRAQCFETARTLAAGLGLPETKWSIGFQSRLTLRGMVDWIKPYTDQCFKDLAEQGVRRLAVVTPSFTADCIETLEELGITGTTTFKEAGGEDLVLIDSLNSSEVWCRNLALIISEHWQQVYGNPAADPVSESTPAEHGPLPR